MSHFTAPGRLAVGPRRAGGASSLSVVLGLIAVTACGGDGESASSSAATTRVDAVVAWRDTLSVRATSVGSLDADAIVELQSEIEGVVSEILADEGQRVPAGAVLVRLDAREERARHDAIAATLRRARAEAENLRVRVERNRGLLEQGAISPQTFDDLKTSYELARARVEEAEANLALARRTLEKTRIRAPFAGTIGERSFYIGDLVRVGTPLYTLVDDDTLEVEFSIPERYAVQVVPGAPTSIRVASLPGQSYQGRVSFISPTVEEGSRTVRLKARIPNSDRALRAGQFADVSVSLEERPEAVVVPETAVVPRAGENFVFVIQQGVARRRSVRLGERRPGLVEIARGVGAGDTVVVAGQQRIQDGTAVAPRLQDRETWTTRAIQESETR